MVYCGRLAAWDGHVIRLALRIEKEDTIPLVPAAVNSFNEIVAAAKQPLPQKWH